MQLAGGAYRAEFGAEPDEAAHYVTGLVVRDYVAAGFPGNPLRFASNYYEHYPKVALGHWPPVFYVGQSAWTLVFGAGRVSVLALMATLAALAAVVIFWFLYTETGPGLAMIGALLFLAFPLVQRASAAVMTEIPICLLMMLAAFSFGRFLERERTMDAVAFGLLASLAILTKLSGFALVLVPPLAILLTRKLHLLKRAAFWWPAGLVAILCGPWTLLTLKFAGEGLEEKWGWQYTHQAAFYYAQKFYLAIGAAVFLLGIIGAAAKLFPRVARNGPSGPWASLAVLFLGVLLMVLLVPSGYEPRYLVPALAPAAVFAMAGADWLARWLARLGLAAWPAQVLVLAVTLGGFGLQTFQVPQKGYGGFGAVAQTLMKRSPRAGTRILISSDARGEGMFISELAMRERRPGSIVRRGSKDLASSSWGGSEYKPRFTQDQPLVAFLQTNSLSFLVVDTSLRPDMRKSYHDLLLRAVEGHPDRFVLEALFPIQRAGSWTPNAIRLYRVAPPR